jgi:hypothetical protein
MGEQLTVGRITQLVEPRCGACTAGHTPYCATCPFKSSVHYRISLAVATMAALSDEKDRHREWEMIKAVLLPERERIMEG